MYGVTMQGYSIVAHVHGFVPYFFVQACPGFRPEDCSRFKVNKSLKNSSLIEQNQQK